MLAREKRGALFGLGNLFKPKHKVIFQTLYAKEGGYEKFRVKVHTRGFQKRHARKGKKLSKKALLKRKQWRARKQRNLKKAQAILNKR